MHIQFRLLKKILFYYFYPKPARSARRKRYETSESSKRIWRELYNFFYRPPCYLRGWYLGLAGSFCFLQTSSSLLPGKRGTHVNCRLSIAATYLTASLPVTNYRFTTLRSHRSRFELFSAENGRDGLGIDVTNILTAGFFENCFLANESLTANKIICFCSECGAICICMYVGIFSIDVF